MEPIVVRSEYSQDLFSRIMKYQLAKRRKSFTIFSIIFAVYAIYLIVGDILSKNMHTYSLGGMFIVLSILFFIFRLDLSQKSIMKKVKKNRALYWDSETLTFLDDKWLLVDSFSDICLINAEYSYTAIAKVHRIDAKTLCIILKNNTYCVVEGADCDKVTDFLSAKLPLYCFE